MFHIDSFVCHLSLTTFIYIYICIYVYICIYIYIYEGQGNSGFAPTMLNLLPAAATGRHERGHTCFCSHRQSWSLHAYDAQFTSHCSHRLERRHTCFPLQSQEILGLRVCGDQFASSCSQRREREHPYFPLQSQAILRPSRLRCSICFPLQP